MSNNQTGVDHLASSTWQPPKAPLSPQRLAKLANALGVSTPIPLSRPPFSRSFLDPSATADQSRRSPSPSVASSTTSKYLLHVIPPKYLQEEEGDDDDPKKLPPPNAPGYHKQFRRGTLVPVHSTLHSQLGAIAREYALPSNAGLILYLFNSDAGELGPRLSEDIWKHLWARVLRAERKDDMLLPSPLRSASPYSPASHSTPFLAQENALRPLMTSPAGDTFPLHPFAPRPIYPIQTSPSTPSSIRSNTKSAPPSSTASQSEPGTPDTSVDDPTALRANSLDLPGLSSPSLIPILAKVEFDIDKRKATWYAPWLRSRQNNHDKRMLKNGTRSDEVPLELLTVKKTATKTKDLLGLSSQVDETNGYARLTDSPLRVEEVEEVVVVEDSEEVDDSEGEDEDATATFTQTRYNNPLATVFRTDEETWADISAESAEYKRKYVHPHVVPLALTGAELHSLPEIRDSEDDNESTSTKEEDEVLELLERMGNPNGFKALPPLVIQTNHASDTNVVAQQGSSRYSDLAYMEPDESSPVIPNHRESVKREFAVFDDLDLGLDPTVDFDDDPNDRRRSQLIMRAKLDEIERTMAQLSPRALHSDLGERSPVKLSPSPRSQEFLSPRNISGEFATSSPPRLPRHSDTSAPDNSDEKSWPAVPFSMFKEKFSESNENPDKPSPPRLAVNGVTASALKSFAPAREPSNGLSESERRRRELVEEHGMYVPRRESPVAEPLIIPLSPDPFGRFSSSTPEPPIPSGRVSLSGEREVNAEPLIHFRSRSGTTSRFSADSLTGEEISSKNMNRTTLMSVKSFKKLWRKSKEKNVPTGSTNDFPPPTPAPPPSAKSLPAIPPQRPERPSEEQLDLPDITIPHLSPQLPHAQPPAAPGLDQGGRRTPQDQQILPPVSRPSLDQLDPPPQLSIPMYQGHLKAGPVTTPMMQASRSASHFDRLHFDQESPYPIRLPSMTRQASPQLPSAAPLPSNDNQDNKSAPPKSILKWKSGTKVNGHVSSGSTTRKDSPPPPPPPAPPPAHQSRQSFERPGGVTSGRGRRPSVINFGSTRATAEKPLSHQLPPPQVAAAAPPKGPSGFKVTNPSVEPSSQQQQQQQREASLDSQSSRPSFDMTQFEFVSPRENR